MLSTPKDSAVPVHIRQEWTRRYDRATGNWEPEYFHLITYADGSTEERWTIPNEWLAIERASKEAA